MYILAMGTKLSQGGLVQCRLPGQVMKKLQKAADDDMTPVAAYVRRLIAKHLDGLDKKKAG